MYVFFVQISTYNKSQLFVQVLEKNFLSLI